MIHYRRQKQLQKDFYMFSADEGDKNARVGFENYSKYHKF